MATDISCGFDQAVFRPRCRRHAAVLHGWLGLFAATALLAMLPAPRASAATYSQGGYTLTVTNSNTCVGAALQQDMVDTFFLVYPQLVQRFNTSATTSVSFTISSSYGGVAYTSGSAVTFGATYMCNHPNDLDVVTHEVMHVVQAYPGGNPSWLVEGIADFARYKYGIRNFLQGWSPTPYSPGQSYTNSYTVTARFLLWLELRKRNSIVDDLNARCRAGTYSSSTWSQLTGQTVDQLWSSYASDPSLTVTASQGRVMLLHHNPGDTYNPATIHVNVPSTLVRPKPRISGFGHNQDKEGIPRVMEVRVNGTAYRVITWLNQGQTSAFSYVLPSSALSPGANTVEAYIHWSDSYYDNGHWVSVDLEAAYCGDGACANGESCSSCAADCGQCQPPPCWQSVQLQRPCL